MSENSKHKVLKTKVETWLRDATTLLENSGIDSAQLDAELILCDSLDVKREWLITHSNEEISANTGKEMLQRRVNREPLAYIRGWKEFYGRDFIVNKNVLIPRPESEVIIEILKELPKPPQHILDVGTGSGALAITAALELPSSSVEACDIDKQALNVAKQNAMKLNTNVAFFESDLLLNSKKKYDVIMANLPYVDETWQTSPETQFEPSAALFAKENGLELIKKLIIQAQDKLSADSFLLLEADPRQHQRIIDFAKEYGFSLFKKQDYIIALES